MLPGIVEVARTARALGFFYAALPLVARRAAGLPPPQARGLVLVHAARARRLGRIELVVDGSENVPEHGAFVLVYNETSLVQDLGNLEMLVRFRIDKAVFAAEYGAIPYFARASPAWGVVLLRRGSRDSVARTLEALVEALRAGERVSMAPQGQISPDGSVCHFKRGAFLVAIRAQVPLVPVGVRGGVEILPAHSVRMRPGVLRYRVGKPISTSGLSEADARDLAEHARQVVAGLVQDSAERPASASVGTPSTAPEPRGP